MLKKWQYMAFITTVLFAFGAYANVNILASNQAGRDYRFDEVGFMYLLCFNGNAPAVDLNEKILINIPGKGMVYLPTLDKKVVQQVKTLLQQGKSAIEIRQELIKLEEYRKQNNIWLSHAQIYTYTNGDNYALYIDEESLKYGSGNLNILSDTFGQLKNRVQIFQDPIVSSSSGSIPLLYQGYNVNDSESLLYRFVGALNKIRKTPGKGGYACIQDSKNDTRYMQVSIRINRHDSAKFIKDTTDKYFFAGKTPQDDGISAVVAQIVRKATVLRFVRGQNSYPYFGLKNSKFGVDKMAVDNLFLTQDVLLKDLHGFKFELKERKKDFSDYPGKSVFSVTINENTRLDDLLVPANQDKNTCYSLFVTDKSGSSFSNSSECDAGGTDKNYPKGYPHKH